MTTQRVVTFGRQPTAAPLGMFREIHFPELASLETPTSEGWISRILHSDGGNSRNLPRTIFFQKTQAPGHGGSVAAGALHEVTIDGETGKASGKGWLIDTPEGHDAATYVAAQALFHNSIDMAEVNVSFEEIGDFWDDDFHLNLHFDQWSVAATTLVGVPAFPDAHGMALDEIRAAMFRDTTPLVVTCPSVYRILVATSDEEIAARATGLPAWSHFFAPEATEPHKIRFGEPDDAGFVPVFGHLALWESCLGDDELRCVRPPRPMDNYASFNKPGVLTDRGEVECGPIALYGGHISLDKAADDPANAWCDVRVVAGVHGPWLSGIVRPGTEDAKLYAARASRISGHWKGGRLRMITSVNAEGYDVPGSGFSITTDVHGEVDELVASFPGCGSPKPSLPAAALSMEPLSEATKRQILEAYKAQGPGRIHQAADGTITTSGSGAAILPLVMTGPATLTTNMFSFDTTVELEMENETDLSIEIARRQRLLALDDD